VTIASSDASVRAAIERFSDDLVGELNVKRVEVAEDDSALCTIRAKANFKVLGKRLGGRMKVVGEAIGALDSVALASLLRGEEIEVEGERIGQADVLVTREVKGGRAAEVGDDMTVVLDTAIDAALRREGLARELVNRVQNLRKDAGLAVSDRIALVLATEGELAEVVQDAALRELIAGETLSGSIELVEVAAIEALAHHGRDEIDGIAVALGLRV
jgi:isoleucyl-tRNA synthetase